VAAQLKLESKFVIGTVKPFADALAVPKLGTSAGERAAVDAEVSSPAK
jgi:hypothetical protein